MIDESKGHIQLQKDADKIEHLLEAQFNSLCLAQCPIVEEIIDTQMFGFGKEVEFAIALELVDSSTGKQLVRNLEIEVNRIYNLVYEQQLSEGKE